jgi:hypothetical protein
MIQEAMHEIILDLTTTKYLLVKSMHDVNISWSEPIHQKWNATAQPESL